MRLSLKVLGLIPAGSHALVSGSSTFGHQCKKICVCLGCIQPGRGGVCNEVARHGLGVAGSRQTCSLVVAKLMVPWASLLFGKRLQIRA